MRISELVTGNGRGDGDGHDRDPGNTLGNGA
jgi:hypothetical protein